MKTDDPKFIDLALKVLSSKATIEERSELEALKASDPALAKEYEEMRIDFEFAKEALPLMYGEVIEAPPMPGYIKNQLKHEIRPFPNAGRKTTGRSWGWFLAWGLAGAAALILIVVGLNMPSPHRTIQLAMLDTVGATRGTNDVGAAILPAFKQSFGQTNVVSYTETAQMTAWLSSWTQPNTVKVVYDRDMGEVRVVWLGKNKEVVTRTFLVKKESDLPAVLKRAVQGINNQ